MPELAGLGVRWPLGGMGFDSGATYERRDTMGGLLSGTSGFSGLPGALLRVGAMVDEREQEAAQNKARADQQAAQLKQQANIGLLQLYAGRMSDKTNPRAEQYKWYVAARDLAQRMGDNTFPDIKENEWNPNFAKYVVRAADIYAKPLTRAERRRLLSAYRAEIAQENPQAALYLQREEDYLTAEHEAEINKWAVREYRILTDAHDLTEAEVMLRHAARAWANHIDTTDDEDTRNLKNESAIILMAAQRRALEWKDAELKRRKDVTLQPPAGTPVYEITQGGAKLLVPGEPPAKTVPPVQAAAATYSRLRKENPTLTREQAATLAFDEHGDVPESLKPFVDPLVEAAKKAAADAEKAKRDQPIGPGATHYVNRFTLESPSPDTPGTELVKKGGAFIAVSPNQAARIPQFRATLSGIDLAGQIVATRKDLFPPSTGNKAQDAAAVAAARLAYQAFKLSGADPDVMTLETLKGQLPQTVRLFGDTGNVSEKEREMAQQFFGVTPATRESIDAKIATIRKLVNESFSLAKDFKPPTPARSSDKAGEIWERGPDGKLRRAR